MIRKGKRATELLQDLLSGQEMLRSSVTHVPSSSRHEQNSSEQNGAPQKQYPLRCTYLSSFSKLILAHIREYANNNKLPLVSTKR
jgi:hypothetical protein